MQGNHTQSKNVGVGDMNSIIWMVGAVVIIIFILGFFGLR